VAGAVLSGTSSVVGISNSSPTPTPPPAGRAVCDWSPRCSQPPPWSATSQRSTGGRPTTRLRHRRSAPGLDPRELMHRSSYTEGVSRFDLVIFDCDGVLVDSERIAIRTESETVTALGWPLTEADIVDLFVGRSVQYMQAEVERHIGRPVDWRSKSNPAITNASNANWYLVAGVVDALDRISVTTCVASSAPTRRCGTPWASPACGSDSPDVSSAPTTSPRQTGTDVFFTPPRHGVAPPRCAVIEDSSSGVTAALAAGDERLCFRRWRQPPPPNSAVVASWSSTIWPPSPSYSWPPDPSASPPA